MTKLVSRPGYLIHKLALNIWFYTVKCFLVCISVLCMPFILLLGHILPAKLRVKFGLLLIWIYGRFWFWAISLSIEFKVLGEEKLCSPPYIFVANHESMLDMYCFGAQKIWDLSVVVRGWPFRLPFLAPFMRMSGYLDADKNPFDFLDQARTLINWGISLLFFPEGTRKKEEILKDFKTGAFKLALQTDLPIVPICIKGTGKLLPPEKKIFTPNSICMQFLDPVEPSNFKDAKRPEKAMSNFIKYKMYNYLSTS